VVPDANVPAPVTVPPTVGLAVAVSVYVTGTAVKLAETDLLEVMETVAGLVVPVTAPLQPLNTYPAAGMAVRVAEVPAAYVPMPLTLPPAVGLAVAVSVYVTGTAVKAATTALLPVIVIVRGLAVPVAAPLHPLNT